MYFAELNLAGLEARRAEDVADEHALPLEERVDGHQQHAGPIAEHDVGYRRHLRWVYLDGSAAVSSKVYRGIDAEARWFDSRGIRVSTVATFRNDTQDDFYGLAGFFPALPLLI